MTVQTRPQRATRMATLLASSTLTALLLHAPALHAQSGASAATASESIDFAIPAQPLDAALKAFIRKTGWQVGYPAGLLNARRSSAVSARMTPQAALRELLSGTGVTLRVTGENTVALADEQAAAAAVSGGEGTVLETILVRSSRGGVALGTGSAADTGTSTVSGGQIVARSEGGDANGILRNLPNIQYQNDTDDEAGATDQTVIDLRPREVSISGARVYENNFILNGMNINTVTGSVDRYGSTSTLSDDETPPNADRLFDLHSQTIYVPTEFLENVTVIDSNASARYGNFQGGVVSYDMKNAPTDRWRGSASSSFTTSDWTGFNIGTESGLNPNGIAHNEYLKRRLALSAGGPITENVAVLGEYSRQSAITHKKKLYRYTEKREIEEKSKNEFYRGQVLAETDLGDFTLEGVYTRYSQDWENAEWRNMRIDLAKRSLATKLEHKYEFEDFTLGGVALSDVKLTSKLGYSSSSSMNDKNGNVARVYDHSVRVARALRFEATDLASWCRSDPALTGSATGKTTYYCYDGALGDLEQGQEQWDWSQDMTGNVWNGSFALGLNFSRTDAYRRRPEDVTYYTNYISLGDVTGISAFNCNTTEECSGQQYASARGIYRAFDIEAGLNALQTYAELEQTWGWVTLRGGLRLSYDDYMENLDLAPRLVATVTPWEGFSISAGANRYYDAQTLAFAIRDKQPRSQSYTRTASGANVGDTWTPGPANSYVNTAAGLKTPYTDELTLGIAGVEPLLGGDWRVRFLDRRAKDQLATQAATSSGPAVLTNDGTGAYQALSAEYSRELQTPPVPGMDGLTFNTSITWAKKEVSNNSYFEEDLDDEYVWYKGRSYTQKGFNVVTGNMDIPLRLQAGLSSAFMDEALQVDLSANYNFAYTGVKFTNVNINVNGKTHEVWGDYDFRPTLTFDLAASYTAYRQDDRSLSFNIKVENLFNQTGNATASTDNPWLIGRTVWAGAKATF